MHVRYDPIEYRVVIEPDIGQAIDPELLRRLNDSLRGRLMTPELLAQIEAEIQEYTRRVTDARPMDQVINWQIDPAVLQHPRQVEEHVPCGLCEGTGQSEDVYDHDCCGNLDDNGDCGGPHCGGGTYHYYDCSVCDGSGDITEEVVELKKACM